MEFDENNCIKFMREAVGPELSAKYKDDDELFNVIDIVFDYLQANGYLDLDLEDDDDDIDMDDLMGYVERMLKKDKGAKLMPEDAAPFVNAYFDYEASLDDL